MVGMTSNVSSTTQNLPHQVRVYVVLNQLWYKWTNVKKNDRIKSNCTLIKNKKYYSLSENVLIEEKTHCKTTEIIEKEVK